MPKLRVHYLPDWVGPDELAGYRCVVVDVLRATTTVVHALAAGAKAVIPCASIEEARRAASTLPAGEIILGGERGGLPIAGFDLGNSPAEYTAGTVGGKTVALTTTNGTRALLHCQSAAEILLGAFVNLAALANWIDQDPSHAGLDVDAVCAGTDGQVSSEDVLLAGALTDRLATSSDWQLDADATLARDAWRSVTGSRAGVEPHRALVSALGDSPGGRNLLAIGMNADIELAAEIDRFAVVPRFDVKTRRIETIPPQTDRAVP